MNKNLEQTVAMNRQLTSALAVSLMLALVAFPQPTSAIAMSDDLNNSNCEVNGDCQSRQSGVGGEGLQTDISEEDVMFDPTGSPFALTSESSRFDGISRAQVLITSGEYDKAAKVLTDELHHAYYTDEAKSQEESKVGSSVVWFPSLLTIVPFNCSERRNHGIRFLRGVLLAYAWPSVSD